MKYLLGTLLISSALWASSIDILPVDREIITNSFNENFDLAISRSEELINRNPDTPKYYYYLINAKVLQYYERVISLDHDKREEGREKINDELITYFESVADKFEDADLNLENKFYYGAILGYLARMQGLAGSWWGAFNSGMEARDIMQEIVDTDPEFYDAYLLLGMTDYYADRLSGFVGFIAGALGFSGDREKGLEYLQLAYNKGHLVFGQTALTLIEIYRSLEDNDIKALGYFEDFLSRFPNNKRMMNRYCHELMNTWNFEKVGSIINNDTNNIVDNYVKARYYSNIGDSQLAVRYAVKSLDDEKYTWRGVNDNARYLIVYNNWLLNNKNEVDKNIDLLNNRYKNVFKQAVSNEEETRWLHGLIVHLSNNNPIAEIDDYIKTKPEFNDSLDYENQYNLLIGSYTLRKGLYMRSENSFNEVIMTGDERARYTACKNLVDLYLRKETSLQKVKKLLSLIDDLDNDRLEYRSRDLSRKYNL